MKKRKFVKILVRGGVAHLMRKSRGVRVEITDYDNAIDNGGEPTVETYEAGGIIREDAT